MAAGGLQTALPRWLSPGPHWLLPAGEMGLLCALVAAGPGRLERRSALPRVGGLVLAGLLSLANAGSAAVLVNDLAGVPARSPALSVLPGRTLESGNSGSPQRGPGA